MMKHLGIVLLACAIVLLSLRSARARHIFIPSKNPSAAALGLSVTALSDAPLTPPTANVSGVDQKSATMPILGAQLSPLESLAVAESLLPRSGVSTRPEMNRVDASEGPAPFYSREAWNCMESINFATSLSRSSTVYTTWPVEIISQNLDSDSTWRQLESTLRRGDVVVFWVRERINGAREFDFATHVQICLGLSHEMWGANNEPRFDLINGVPAPTKKWWVCSAQEYYQAMAAQDPVWRTLGHERRYYVVVYHCPESRGELVRAN